MREMQKKDREILDKGEIVKIIDSCSVLRLGLCEDNKPYVIPMNYGYTFENGELTLYFHSANKGTKLDIVEKNNNVCFEIDCEHRLIEAKLPCQYTFEFSSVVGFGMAEIITDPLEKTRAAQIFMRHVSGKEFEFNERLVSIITLWRVKVESFKGKRRKVATL